MKYNNVFNVSSIMTLTMILFTIFALLSGVGNTQAAPAVMTEDVNEPWKLGNQPALTAAEKTEVQTKIATIQMPFIANQGQMDEQVAFYADTFSGRLFVTKTGELVYALPNGDEDTVIKGVALRESFVGGTVQFMTGKEEAVTQVSAFKGHDPAKWQRNLPSYMEVDLGEVYPGIGITLKAHGNNVEKLFTVQPGALPETIRLNIRGNQWMKVNAAGELAVTTELGTVLFTKPVAYQEHAEQRTSIEVAYVAAGQEYGFTVGAYDRDRPLVIDPLLASTFLGGSQTDWVTTLAVDSSDNVYVGGATHSVDFPTTPGVYDQTFNGSDRDWLIAKFNPSLTTLLAATFLGGGGVVGTLAIDSAGNVYGSGNTKSSDFPTTTGAYDRTYNGSTGWYYGGDAVIVKLDASLTTLIASTYLGGSGDDGCGSLVFDGSGNVYVIGQTSSANFPTTPGAYDETYNGGGIWWHDLVIAKLDASLTTLIASTYLGGSDGSEQKATITLDSQGNIYVSGRSESADFPTTSDAYDTTWNGGIDAVIAKLDPTLSTLLAATFLGGNQNDYGSITLDSNDNVYSLGTTASADFPTTSGAYDTTWNGSEDIFIATLDSTLTTLVAATFK